MDEAKVLGLEIFGRNLFNIATRGVSGADSARTEHEKEGFVVAIFAEADELLSLSDQAYTEDELRAVRKGLNMACEEWVRPTSEPSLQGVSS